MFTAIPVPDPVRERLESVRTELACVWPAGTVRWTRPDQLHLTLRFHGQVPSCQLEALVAELRNATVQVPAFRLNLGRLGGFPNRENPRVLWAGLEGDLSSLDQLTQSVSRASASFGDHQEDKPFHPHLTLGRVNPSPHARRPSSASRFTWWQFQPDPVTWLVEECLLFQSSLEPGGARHRVIATVPLANDIARDAAAFATPVT